MNNVENSSGKNDENPNFFSDEGVTTQGITEDFVWYEAEILLRDMSAWESRLKRLVSVMEARHKEHLHMIDGLLHEVTILKRKANERT